MKAVILGMLAGGCAIQLGRSVYHGDIALAALLAANGYVWVLAFLYELAGQSNDKQQ